MKYMITAICAGAIGFGAGQDSLDLAGIVSLPRDTELTLHLRQGSVAHGFLLAADERVIVLEDEDRRVWVRAWSVDMVELKRDP